jgi:hypothetical protein
MSKTLHQKYPDYQRRKYKVFLELCEAGFNYLQKTAAAQASQEQSPKPIEVSESRSVFVINATDLCHHYQAA